MVKIGSCVGDIPAVEYRNETLIIAYRMRVKNRAFIAIPNLI